jgi:hypothetical protein
MRKLLNQIIRKYAYKNGGIYQETWNRVYSCFSRLFRLDIKARAASRGMKTIAYADSRGLLPLLVCVALVVTILK